MLLSCLKTCQYERCGLVIERTLAGEHLCTGNQSCSLCKTDKVVLHHTSACAHGSGCMPEWLGPVFCVLGPAALNTGLGKDSGLHRGQADRTVGQAGVAHGKLHRLDEEG